MANKPASVLLAKPSPRMTMTLLGLVSTVWALGRAAPRYLTPSQKFSWMRDQTANINLNGALTLAFVIIGAVIAVTIVAQLAPTYILAIAGASSSITNTSFGNTTADSLRSVMALVVAIGGLVGLVVLIVGAIALHKK